MLIDSWNHITAQLTATTITLGLQKKLCLSVLVML